MLKTRQQFKGSHAVQHELKVTACHANTGRASSVSCGVRVVFCCEEKVGAKLKRTRTVKFFSTFSADGYELYFKQQHDRKWAEYQQLSTSEENAALFSEVRIPFVNNLAADGCNMSPLHLDNNRLIVDVIIGELFFHPDDVEGVTNQRAILLFSKLESADPANEDLA